MADPSQVGLTTTPVRPAGLALGFALVAWLILALALPLYPRAAGVALGDVMASPQGAAPLRDADLKPFAGLGKLMDLPRKPDTSE